ncbi:MAG: hypothetical protein V2J55_22410 [Candidatus Competibacteraceae bacterium]|jgi:hypothetical protein|nr:hypothetical protein [Candidatus Competibacteraceae bacterium]
MKKVAATFFVLSTGLGMNTVALAEPFNDRDVNPITASQTDGTTALPMATTNATHPFNDRDRSYIVEAHAGNPSQDPVISFQGQARDWNS